MKPDISSLVPTESKHQLKINSPCCYAVPCYHLAPLNYTIKPKMKPLTYKHLAHKSIRTNNPTYPPTYLPRFSLYRQHRGTEKLLFSSNVTSEKDNHNISAKQSPQIYPPTPANPASFYSSYPYNLPTSYPPHPRHQAT